MSEVPQDELEKLQHLDARACNPPRAIPLFPLWEGGRWQSWVYDGSSVIPMPMTELVIGLYFAKERHSINDLDLSFIAVAVQHLCTPDLIRLSEYITNDIQMVATTLAKIRFAFKARSEIGDGVTKFVEADLEYLLTICRSLFDLVNMYIGRLYDRYITSPPGASPINRLPDSFAKVVLSGGKQLSSEDISKKYGLPEPLSVAYSGASGFFKQLRGRRDLIVHKGHQSEFVYLTERGFCVPKEARLWLPSPGEDRDEMYNDNLISLFSLCSDVAYRTVASLETLSHGLQKSIQLTYPAAPEYQVFVKCSYSNELKNVLRVQRGELTPWESEQNH